MKEELLLSTKNLDLQVIYLIDKFPIQSSNGMISNQMARFEIDQNPKSTIVNRNIVNFNIHSFCNFF